MLLDSYMQPVGLASADVSTVIGHGRLRWLRRVVWRVVPVLVALVAILAIVRWWRARGASATVTLQTQQVAVGELTLSVTATGSLKTRDSVVVGSEVSGRVKRILVEDNQRVSAGQTLAQIDPEVLAAQVEQSRAARDQAAAQVQQAKATQHEATLTRVRNDQLFARGVVSQQEVEGSRAAAARANAAVSLTTATLRQATANVKVAETNLTKANIRSPIDGIVLSHSVEEGQTVVAAFQTPVMFEIATDLRALELSVDVDEADIGRVHEGQAAMFTVAAYADREFQARVIKVHNASRIVDRVVSYEAELSVDNNGLLLRPGMTATARIVVEQVKDEKLVPAQSLRFSPKGTTPLPGKHVWVVRARIPIPVPVKVLGEGETLAAVRSPLLDSRDLVITNTR